MSEFEEQSLIHNETLSFLIRNYPQSLNSIPNEVLDFGLPNRAVTLAFVVCIGLLLVISVTGNSIMIYLFGRFKTLRTPSNKLVINLSVSNLIMHAKSWILITNGLDGGPLLGDIGKSYFFRAFYKLYCDSKDQLVKSTIVAFIKLSAVVNMSVNNSLICSRSS